MNKTGSDWDSGGMEVALKELQYTLSEIQGFTRRLISTRNILLGQQCPGLSVGGVIDPLDKGIDLISAGEKDIENSICILRSLIESEGIKKLY